MTPEQCRQKIDLHLQRGDGIHAIGKGLGRCFFMARVQAHVLQIWDGDHWVNVPRGARFRAGNGRDLFEYEDG